MEIYNKSTPFDIFNTRLFPREKFESNNIITMRLHKSKDIYNYSFSMNLPNITLSQVVQDKINNIINIQNSEIEIYDDFISFSSKINSESTSESEIDVILNKMLNDIFKIIFDNINLSDDMFFGISYNYMSKLYNGYFFSKNIKN